MPRIILLILAAMILAACQAPTSTQASGYQTVVNDWRRNTELAAKKHQAAKPLIREGEYEQAEELIRQALSADVMFGPAHNSLGKVYYHTGRFYLAAWEFEYAAKLMPHQPEPRNNLGLVFESVGKLDEAVAHYDHALELAPDNAELLGNLTRARLRRGDHGPEIRQLLTDLMMKDTRPQWRDWAGQTLGVMPREQAEDDH